MIISAAQTPFFLWSLYCCQLQSFPQDSLRFDLLTSHLFQALLSKGVHSNDLDPLKVSWDKVMCCLWKGLSLSATDRRGDEMQESLTFTKCLFPFRSAWEPWRRAESAESSSTRTALGTANPANSAMQDRSFLRLERNCFEIRFCLLIVSSVRQIYPALCVQMEDMSLESIKKTLRKVFQITCWGKRAALFIASSLSSKEPPNRY